MESMDWLEEDDDNLEADFKSLEQKHLVHGFREGLSKGQDYILQSAFNDGFKKSALLMEKLAKYRGTVSALYMYLMNTSEFTKEIGSKFELLISKLEEYENDPNRLSVLKVEKEETNLGENITTITGTSKDNLSIDTLTDYFGKLDKNDESCCAGDENTACCANLKDECKNDIKVNLKNDSTNSNLIVDQTLNYSDTKDVLNESCNMLYKLVNDTLFDVVSSMNDSNYRDKIKTCLEMLKNH